MRLPVIGLQQILHLLGHIENLGFHPPVSLMAYCRPVLIWSLPLESSIIQLRVWHWRRVGGVGRTDSHLLVHMGEESTRDWGGCFAFATVKGQDHRVLWTGSAKSPQREHLSQEKAEHLPSISEYKRRVALSSGEVEERRHGNVRLVKKIILANKYHLSLSLGTSWKDLSPGNIKSLCLAKNKINKLHKYILQLSLSRKQQKSTTGFLCDVFLVGTALSLQCNHGEFPSK